MNPFDESHRIPVNDRVVLTPLAREDKSALVRHLHNRQIYATTLRVPFPYTEADAEKFLDYAGQAIDEQGQAKVLAIRDSAAGLIGGIGFDGLVVGHLAEIGYWLAEEHWGRGIMTAVVGAACEFGIRRWNLVRIQAHVFDFNPASARVLEKNGFVLEGVLRRHRIKDGQFLDSRLYAKIM